MIVRSPKKRNKKAKLSFLRLDVKGIPLRELIAVHEQFHARNSLRDNLGDGFLYHQNPVYRHVRDEYARLGFRFTDRDFADYYAYPLMALDEAIDAGKIPYRRNFAWLKKLERSAPGLFTLPTLKASELQYNYLFHESAHFLAHRRLFGRISPKKVPKTQDSLLRIMLGESFANTAECLSAAYAEGEIGTYFLEANCHFRANREEVKVLRRSVRRWGGERVARALLAAFLYSNFLYERLSAAQRKRVGEFSQIDEPMAPLLAIGLQLSEEFRQTTTPLHLWKLGFPPNLPRLLRFDPLAKLLEPRNLALRSQALSLAKLLVLP